MFNSEMKFKSFFLLLAVASVFAGCMDTTGVQTTPEMLLGNVYVNPQFVGDSLIGAKDTLEDHYNMEDGFVYLDTLQLGDTVMFSALFSANMNNLVSVSAKYDTLKVNMWFDIDPEEESVKKALKEDLELELLELVTCNYYSSNTHLINLMIIVVELQLFVMVHHFFLVVQHQVNRRLENG